MAVESASDAAPESYLDLLEHYKQVANLKSTQMLLRWDQQVMMPPGGTPARSRELSALSGIQHELLTDVEVGTLLTDLEDAELTGPQAGAVREIRREHKRADRVPRHLIETISEKTSEALPVWERAREEDDFDAFAPALEELIELQRGYANHIDPDKDPYEVLFEEYEPYLGLDTAERVLGRLRDELVPLIDEIAESGVELATPFAGGTYPEAKQEALARDVLDVLDYDWNRGRLDTSTHPFTSGNQFDCRITTRFDESEPLDALSSTIHEFGHAAYNLGLPQDEYGTPLGNSRDLTVHESQSRLWENHIGRTRSFWQRILPLAKEHLDGIDDMTVDEVYQAANQVYPDNLIRVEADELTYHMHIVLRFEIERALISGDLAVEDIPQVWNDKMEEYLGVRPENDTMGCLQDIHWSHGSFGYFPTYSLGSVLAAQLDHHIRQDIDDFDGNLREGAFGELHDWLTDKIHRHGARYTTPALIREATGEDYTADYFIDYVTAKFGDLYGL